MSELDPFELSDVDDMQRAAMLGSVIDDRSQPGASAQVDPQVLAEVGRIYRDVIARKPEHDPNPSLDRVERVLALMGDPHKAIPAVHITGTNGKTSTARMIDSLLSAAGLRVGRFTSPHLSDPRERISIGGDPISPEGFVEAFEDVAPFVQMVDEQCRAEGRAGLSFFEVFTVMAFAAFAAAPVDVAVVEVGMGGRWDATNVIDAQVAVIMPVALDHQRWLGSTVEEIATEKVGIIKHGATVVCAQQLESVTRIVAEAVSDQDAVLRLWERDFGVVSRLPGVGGQALTLRTPAATYEDVPLRLFGRHQAQNAAAALTAVEAFLGGKVLGPELVEGGFAEATSPGRLEVIKQSPTILADGAHNPAGIAVLLDALEENFDFERTYCVFGAMADKSVELMLGMLEPVIDQIVVTALPGDRAMPLEDLERLASDVFGSDRVLASADLAGALDQAAQLVEESSTSMTARGIVVCGSVALVGAARSVCGLS